MINDDCISRKMAVEAIEGIVSSKSVCLSVEECYGMKRMQKRAIEEVINLPAIQTTNHIADVSKKVVSSQPVRCKNCKYAHMTISGSCKYCDQFTDDYGQLVEMYFDKDFFCGYAERKAE